MRKSFSVVGLILASSIASIAGNSRAAYDTIFVTKDSMFVYTRSILATPLNWKGEYFYLSRKGKYKEVKTKIDGFTLVNNVEIGQWNYYYPEGRIFQKKFFKEGNEDGERETYNESGKLVEKKYYKVGVFYDKNQRVEYNEAGVKTSEHQINSKKEYEGKFTTYYETGTVKEQGFYQKGKETGVWTEYNEKGQKAMTINFSEPNGMVVSTYYASGEIAGEAFYRKNSEEMIESHGKFTKYYLSGNVELVGYYDAGLKNGEWNYYDLEGKIIKTEIYDKDQLIEKKF